MRIRHRLFHVTRPTAQDVLDNVTERYATAITPGHGPTLEQDWPGPYGTIGWVINWPDGPPQWAVHAVHDGVLSDQATTLEPVTGCVLALYLNAESKIRRARC
jgi:hypothetical protein